jgi:hypothetical protein
MHLPGFTRQMFSLASISPLPVGSEESDRSTADDLHRRFSRRNRGAVVGEVADSLFFAGIGFCFKISSRRFAGDNLVIIK